MADSILFNRSLFVKWNALTSASTFGITHLKFYKRKQSVGDVLFFECLPHLDEDLFSRFNCFHHVAKIMVTKIGLTRKHWLLPLFHIFFFLEVEFEEKIWNAILSRIKESGGFWLITFHQQQNGKSWNPPALGPAYNCTLKKKTLPVIFVIFFLVHVTEKSDCYSGKPYFFSLLFSKFLVFHQLLFISDLSVYILAPTKHSFQFD